eukprot:2375663-Prorocentrum_lima.AAC.1
MGQQDGVVSCTSALDTSAPPRQPTIVSRAHMPVLAAPTATLQLLISPHTIHSCFYIPVIRLQ